MADQPKPTDAPLPPLPGQEHDPWFLRIDRRIVYLFVAIALGAPLFFESSMPPAPLETAKRIYDKVEAVARARDEAEARGETYDKIVLVAADWGPSTAPELYPQTEAVIRHLMWRKIKFAIVTLDREGDPFCVEIPHNLAKEYGTEYGKDWVNLGFRFGNILAVKQMAEDFQGAAPTDAEARKPLSALPVTKNVKEAEDIKLVVEINGSVGVLQFWLGYFQSDRAKPELAHGCTAITIPEAFNYLQSGQIVGLFEGIAGAAAYNELLDAARAPGEPSPSQHARRHMTSQTFAHLMIFVFILLGNIGIYIRARRQQERAGGPS